MERESFESEEVAELMNRHFVNVKVDREERPDVDKTYMTNVQVCAYGKSGVGWGEVRAPVACHVRTAGHTQASQTRAL